MCLCGCVAVLLRVNVLFFRKLTLLLEGIKNELYKLTKVMRKGRLIYIDLKVVHLKTNNAKLMPSALTNTFDTDPKKLTKHYQYNFSL